MFYIRNLSTTRYSNLALKEDQLTGVSRTIAFFLEPDAPRIANVRSRSSSSIRNFSAMVDPRALYEKRVYFRKSSRAGHLKFATVPRLPSSPGYDVTCLRQTTAWQASRRAKEDGGQKSRVRGQWTDDRSLTTRGKDGILAE